MIEFKNSYVSKETESGTDSETKILAIRSEIDCLKNQSFELKYAISRKKQQFLENILRTHILTAVPKVLH